MAQKQGEQDGISTSKEKSKLELKQQKHRKPYLNNLDDSSSKLTPWLLGPDASVTGIPETEASFYNLSSSASEVIPEELACLLHQTNISFRASLPHAVSYDAYVNRHYTIINQLGHRLYYAGEVSNQILEWCCNGHRPFHINFFDRSGNTLMVAAQLCTCGLFCCRGECHGANMQMLMKSGELLGSVTQKFTCFSPRYSIKDPTGLTIMKVSGPRFGVCCQFFGRTFQIHLVNVPGKKQDVYLGLIQKTTVRVPKELPVQNKALLIGMLFFIEFNYYQSNRTYCKLFVIFGAIFIILCWWRVHTISSL